MKANFREAEVTDIVDIPLHKFFATGSLDKVYSTTQWRDLNLYKPKGRRQLYLWRMYFSVRT